MSLHQEFQEKKSTLARLRQQYNFISQEKEKLFQELRVLRDKLKPKNDAIKALKAERDAFTAQVKEAKKERDVLNQVVKEKAGVIKEVDKKKKELLDADSTESPGSLQAQIKRLETKLETEVMPFEKEKELNKVIKELKAKFKQAEKVNAAWKEVKTVSADFMEQRKKAQQSHHSVQDLAKASQEKHQRIVALYEDIKQLRKQETAPLEKYFSFKKQAEELQQQGREIQKRLDELKKILHEEDEKSFHQIAREKTAQVQDKLKRGKKLSTEDILAFQAMKEN